MITPAVRIFGAPASDLLASTVCADRLHGDTGYSGRARGRRHAGASQRGAEIYALNCSPCHGPRLYGEECAFDLRTFPRDQRQRFITSVANGRNQKTPWGALLKPDDIEALWAYVLTGEK